MLKTIGIVVAALLGGLLIFAATKPDTFTIQRSASIKASPEALYAQISDFHRWADWSPYDKLDPAMKKTYRGAESGVGAIYEWEGSDKVGQGNMEIVEAVPGAKVVTKLNFVKPFQANNVAEFTLETKGDTTHVTWAMRGPNSYMSKVMCIFIDMDKMVGKDFETGLGNLKALAEK
ncbi:SRPBCC family protein [bacterium]|nr:SRPBCC family protein [bacterium]